MKAVQMDQIGGPDVLQFRDVPEPVAGVGQLIVAVHAASANPGVVKVRKGQRRAFLNSGFPHTMGRDYSGAVRAVGAGVTEFKAGDAVFGVLPLNVEGTAAGTIALMKLSESVAAHRLLESGTQRGKIVFTIRSLTADVLSRTQADAILAALWKLEAITQVSELVDLCTITATVTEPRSS